MKIVHIVLTIIGLALIGGVAYLAVTPANITQSDVSTDVSLDGAPVEQTESAVEATVETIVETESAPAAVVEDTVMEDNAVADDLESDASSEPVPEEAPVTTTP
ncbi:MAG: hypothetical protein LRZ85_06805 [Alphaproteobacteria bacterium]|nr:hypothetical protein [Alphaproteobacteria bacterium]MCD8526434.1 hypothetical protein [Alphaproteobacteria bacterium]MCD8571510.1 hypothetical protein [Alphaproteobacteria bacterium]